MNAKYGKKFLINFSNLSFSMILSTVCSFLCFAILGNKMSVGDYGQFSAIIALASSVAIFINNVFASIVANREIAINPTLSRKLFLTFLKVRILVFVIACVPLTIYARNVGYERSLVVGLISLLFVDSFFELFEQIAFGLKLTKYSMILNSASSIVWLLFVWLLPAEYFCINVILLVFSFVSIIRTLAYCFVDFKVTKQYKGVISNLSYRYLFFNSLPYLYNRLLGIISVQLPIILLGGHAGLNETAYYSVGEKFTTPISKLTMVVVSSAFPFITAALKENRQKIGHILLGAFQLILSFGTCFCLLLSSVSDWGLLVLFGEKYIAAAEAFNYQIWFTIVIMIDSLFSMTLSADFKQKTLSVITTIDALSLIPFLYFGIDYGAKGVALAKLIYSTACLLYHVFIALKYWGKGISYGRIILSWCLFAASACLCVFYPLRVVLISATLITFIFAILLNYPILKMLTRKLKKKN